jgi:hypothetical protein
MKKFIMSNWFVGVLAMIIILEVGYIVYLGPGISILTIK